MNFIIDCTYVYEGEKEVIELDAKIDLTTGIITDIQTSDAYEDIDAGNCLSETVEFIFEQKNYYLTIEYKGKNLCIKDMHSISLFQAIDSLLQLQNELPTHSSKKMKTKI